MGDDQKEEELEVAETVIIMIDKVKKSKPPLSNVALHNRNNLMGLLLAAMEKVTINLAKYKL